VRYRQGMPADAIAIIEQATKVVPTDEYLAMRLEYFRKAAPGSAAASKLKR